MTEVARRYEFRATHSLPQLAPPWNEPHEHLYTVEVVAHSQRMTDMTDDILSGFLDTDVLDRVWEDMGLHRTPDLDQDWPGDTSVESLAEDILLMFDALDLPVVEVTVWEDTTRWGRARR